ncbi:MAG: hypothetical protein P1P64_05000 [Treponemataceae bacterium]
MRFGKNEYTTITKFFVLTVLEHTEKTVFILPPPPINFYRYNFLNSLHRLYFKDNSTQNNSYIIEKRRSKAFYIKDFISSFHCSLDMLILNANLQSKSNIFKWRTLCHGS